MHVGTYFVFAFFESNTGGFTCEFAITAMSDAAAHVTAPAVDLDQTDHIAQGTSQLYSLYCDAVEAISGVEEKSIIIKSNADVQVEVMALVNHGLGDSFLLYPVHPASTEFVTAAYYDPEYDHHNNMVIAVASEPNTTIIIYRYMKLFPFCDKSCDVPCTTFWINT